jgi:hypothetical protein
MGNLTDDMTRLRGEVDALRGTRGVLMSDLTRGARDLTTVVAAMRADFTSAHAAMAKQTRRERETFVADVSAEVNSLLGEFSRDRNDMARKGRHDRRTFLSEMSRQVAGMCQETANDLLGARLVWRGKSPGKSPTVPEKKEPELESPVKPPVEETIINTIAAPEFEAEKPPVIFNEPLKEEEKKAIVAEPEIKTENPPLTFMEPLKRKEEKKTVAALQAQAFTPPEVKMPPPVFAAPNVLKQKEKSWLDEKPAKTTIKKPLRIL